MWRSLHRTSSSPVRCRRVNRRAGGGSVRRAALLATLVLLGLAAGCTVGPRYSRPAAPAPAPDAWKTQPPWQQAAPQDSIPKGEWWKIFNDAELNAYRSEEHTS